MDRYERCKDIPHFDIIQENETIYIPSLFMFKKGCTELFSFLFACEQYNCTVIFENEDIKISPQDDNSFLKTELAMYATIAENPKVVSDYISYLNNSEKMIWVKGVREPILKKGEE